MDQLLVERRTCLKPPPKKGTACVAHANPKKRRAPVAQATSQKKATAYDSQLKGLDVGCGSWTRSPRRADMT